MVAWSQRSLQQYWHLRSYMAGLPDARWVSRILVWRPRNTGKRGAPFRLRQPAAETFCRWKGLGDWKTAAMNTQRWYQYTADFCSLIFESCGGFSQIPTVQTPVPSMGYQGQCATGLQVSLTYSGDNCRKRRRCWTQMVGLYFVSGGQWKVNFGHHLSFTGRRKGILCQQTDAL